MKNISTELGLVKQDYTMTIKSQIMKYLTKISIRKNQINI